MMGNAHMFKNTNVESFQTIERIPQSHHLLSNTLESVLSQNSNKPETLSFAMMTVCAVVLTSILVYRLVCGGTKNHGFENEPTQTPSFFEALRQADLEEMIEEEKVYVNELNTQNMSKANLEKADMALAQRQGPKSKQMVISGEPYYQIFKNFDHWLKFNLQYASEERNVKVLLNLPLVPPANHNQVKLVSHWHFRSKSNQPYQGPLEKQRL